MRPAPPAYLPAFAPSPILENAALRERFLDELGTCGEVSAAAATVGVPRTSLYRARRMLPDFAHGWAAVMRHRQPGGGRAPGTAATDRSWPASVRARFLDSLARTGAVPGAAAAAGKTIDVAYRLRAADPAFARDWDAAIERAVDAVEAVLFDRALNGFTRTVVQAGKIVTDVHEYSDALAIFLLRARRSGVYGTGKAVAADAGPVTPPVTREDLLARINAMLARDPSRAGTRAVDEAERDSPTEA